MPGSDNAVWDDGEWVSWHEIDRQIQHQEWCAKYPNAIRALVPVFEQLMESAESYFCETGKHLQIYGVIGELFGAITHGICLHKNYAQGSDGRLGDHFVEIKTITPLKKCDEVYVKTAGHFSKLLIVKISQEFEIASRLIDRKKLKKCNGKLLRVKWQDVEATT